MKRFDHKNFSLAVLALLAGACVVNVEEGAPVTDGNRLVTLALSVPAQPVTRGPSTGEEDAVHFVDVLLFTDDANEYFRYRAIGSQPVDKTVGVTDKKKFNVRLPEGTWNVIVLANAREAIANSSHETLLTPASLAKENNTVTRVDVLDSLVEQSGSTGDKWNVGGIPMWGYYDSFKVDEAPGTPDVQLTRAIARVNIPVSDEEYNGKVATDFFEMSSAYLYN
jgi:hypothetical protein